MSRQAGRGRRGRLDEANTLLHFLLCRSACHSCSCAHEKCILRPCDVSDVLFRTRRLCAMPRTGQFYVLPRTTRLFIMPKRAQAARGPLFKGRARVPAHGTRWQCLLLRHCRHGLCQLAMANASITSLQGVKAKMVILPGKMSILYSGSLQMRDFTW